MTSYLFGVFAVLFVAGSIILAWVVFTPGSQAFLSVVAALMIAIGAQGMRDGLK